MTDERPSQPSDLSKPDEHAVEAALAAIRSGRPASADPRVQRAVELLSLLGVSDPVSDRESRIDATMARVMRESASDGAARDSEADAFLLPDDEEALEAWMNEGQNAARVPASLRERARRIQALASLVRDAATDDNARASRIDRTMAMIEKAPLTLKFQPVAGGEPGRSSLRLADLISIAAVLLLGASVVWPLMSTARNYSGQSRCSANLANIAMAMDQYGADNRGALPRASASFAGPWWNVGDTQSSNSASMVVLSKLGYTSLQNFACPGNPAACAEARVVSSGDWQSLDQVSYSYRLAPKQALDAPLWDHDKPTIVMADASPVVRRARARQPIFPGENSMNHTGRGQTALRSDGSAVWLSSPVYGKDNIWLPAYLEDALAEITRQIQQGRSRGSITIEGVELPGRNDIMLAP